MLDVHLELQRFIRVNGRLPGGGDLDIPISESVLDHRTPELPDLPRRKLLPEDPAEVCHRTVDEKRGDPLPGFHGDPFNCRGPVPAPPELIDEERYDAPPLIGEVVLRALDGPPVDDSPERFPQALLRLVAHPRSALDRWGRITGEVAPQIAERAHGEINRGLMLVLTPSITYLSRRSFANCSPEGAAGSNLGDRSSSCRSTHLRSPGRPGGCTPTGSSITIRARGTPRGPTG